MSCENTLMSRGNAMQITDEAVCGLRIRTAQRAANNNHTQPPLLIFGGFGANIELQMPFIETLHGIRTIIFDLPGVGGSSRSLLPMTFADLAELSARLLRRMGCEQADALGMSWGGALAQEFAYRHPQHCRRLVLASTCSGRWIIPGELSLLLKLANPRRYWDRNYLKSIAGEIYGGRLRGNPDLVEQYIALLRPLHSPLDYFWQLYASAGWTSAPWLRQLRQPTLILSGTEDPILPRENACVLHEQIANSELVEFDDGHLLLFASREEAAQLIRNFLRAENPLPLARDCNL